MKVRVTLPVAVAAEPAGTGVFAMKVAATKMYSVSARSVPVLEPNKELSESPPFPPTRKLSFGVAWLS